MHKQSNPNFGLSTFILHSIGHLRALYYYLPSIFLYFDSCVLKLSLF